MERAVVRRAGHCAPPTPQASEISSVRGGVGASPKSNQEDGANIMGNLYTTHRTTSAARGFTLVELMIVVVILGLLAAVAIPAFSRYVKRSKTTEASSGIASMYRLQLAYYENTQERTSNTSFATCAALPTTSPGSSKYPSNVALWMNASDWNSLGFVMNRPHYYQYSTDGSNTATTVRAVGDIDGDTSQSTFGRSAALNAGEVQGSRMQIVNELE
jgi:prepilin-type N-terminal cleavage/methylation domain-containing protein